MHNVTGRSFWSSPRKLHILKLSAWKGINLVSCGAWSKGVELEGRSGHPSLGRHTSSIGQNTEFVNKFSLLLNNCTNRSQVNLNPGFSDGHNLLLFHFSDMCAAELARGGSPACYIAIAVIPTIAAGGLRLCSCWRWAGCSGGVQAGWAEAISFGCTNPFFTILFGFGLGPQLDHAGMRNKQKQRTIK